MPFTILSFVRADPCGPALCLLVVLLVGGALLGSVQRVRAQGQYLTVHSKSRFWIEGEATTHDFTCRVDRVEGQAELPPPERALASSPEERQTKVVVEVPVRAFDCGNRLMTKDLQETLKMRKYPTIHFELVHASIGAPPDSSAGWRAINVLGTLTIAGRKRLVDLEAKGQVIGEHRFRVRGCKPILMTDFNIDPPTKAFGIIKVKDRVVVQFDLLAYAPGNTSDSPFEGVSVDDSPTCPIEETRS